MFLISSLSCVWWCLDVLYTVWTCVVYFTCEHSNVQVMKVAKCPTDELSLTNCAVVSEQDFDVSRIRFSAVYCCSLCVCVCVLRWWAALCHFLTVIVFKYCTFFRVTNNFFSFSNSDVTRGTSINCTRSVHSVIYGLLSLANGSSAFGTLFPKMSISVDCCDLSAVFNVLIFLVTKCF